MIKKEEKVKSTEIRKKGQKKGKSKWLFKVNKIKISIFLAVPFFKGKLRGEWLFD